MNSSGNNSQKNKTQKRTLLKPLPPRRRLPRYISALCGVTFASASSLVLGLGLGEMNSRSFLGQPLNASIELVSLDGDIDPNTLIVRQVTPEEAAAMGVDIFYSPYRINLSFDSSAAAHQISVTSSDPIREPYLSLMVELRWPKGVVYREYPLLLDPPPLVPVREAPAETRPVSRPTPAPSTPPVVSSSPSRAPTQMRLEPLATDEGKYKVQPGDTLSKIAARWREGTTQTISETSQWLFENNSHAFASNDINRLLAGAVLQMPNLSSYQTSESVPVAEVPPSSAPLPTSGSGEGLAAVSESGESAARVAERPVGNDAARSRDMRGLLTLGADDRDDRTRELIDMLVRENETLKMRMEKIESSEYLETLKQLIVLQRQQISELRQKLGVPDSDMSEEMDTLLGQIGVSIDEAEARARDADLSLSAQTTTLASAENPEVASVLEVEPAVAPPIAERESRSWLVWLMFGAAAALSALFIGLFAYYRRMVPGKQRAEESRGDLLRSAPRYPSRTEPTLALQREEESDLADLQAELTPVYAYKKKNEENWLGEKAAEIELGAEDLDATIKEMQDAFEDLVLDEEALNSLEDLEEDSLEGLTEDLPQEPVANVAAVPVAQDKPKKDKRGKKKDQSNRRPDEEVRMSIAEKMAQYNPEEYRQEMENLGLLELDELAEIEEDAEDVVDTIVYRAMMFCEFKKFDKARELIEDLMESSDDPRLSAALDEVEILAKEAAQADTKKAM